jgi:hypothetical protein
MARITIMLVGLLLLAFAPAAPAAAARGKTSYGTTGAGGGDSVGITVNHGRIVTVQLKLHSKSCTNGESLVSEAFVQPNAALRGGRFSFTSPGEDTKQSITMRGHRVKRGFQGTVSLTVTTAAYTCRTGPRTFKTG